MKPAIVFVKSAEKSENFHFSSGVGFNDKGVLLIFKGSK